MNEGMQAVVMAGGEGSRLRPLTTNMPKPMLPIANRPLMEHIIMLLRKNGLTDIVVTVQYLSSVIRNYFGDGSDLGVSLSYSTEDVPLGTAGSVLNAADLLTGTFVVISGDALTDLDLARAVSWHKERDAAATVVLKAMADPLDFGIVMTDDDGRIERFLEKPSWGQVFSDRVNTGIYVLEPEVLDLIPPEQPFDFSAELFPMMIDKGLPLYGFTTDAYWTDVGNTDAYLQAQYDALEDKVATDIGGFEFRPKVWVGEDAEIDPSARLDGPLLIGDNCRIGPEAAIGPFSVIGDNVILGADAHVVNAVVMDGATVAPSGRVLGAVLGRGAAVERGATLEEGAIVGDESSVGAGALVKTAVKISPARSVEAGAIVTHSVVRERRARRSLFGSRGVAGRINAGVTPQLAVRLGMAYGSTLKPPSVVVTGRDASRAARTMKRALIAGLNATGVSCHDLELMSMPVTRFTVRSAQAAGGVSVRTSPSDAEVVEIRLFDGDGADISEDAQRKIDRVFFREDYRRPGPHKLGDLDFPPHAVEQYTAGLLADLETKAIRGRKPKVVVDYAYGPASMTGPSVLGRLGCDALALNAFTDEHRPIVTSDAAATLLDELAQHVKNSGSDVGVLLEPGGEIAHIVDDGGRPIGHERAFLALLRHQVTTRPGEVVVPVCAPSVSEQIVRDAGGRMYWTATGLPSLMARAAIADATFAGNAEGTLIFPRFMPAPDGFMTLCKTLELISVAEKPLSEVVDSLPEVHVARREAVTPAVFKGAVMRRIAARSKGGRLVLFDGVKVIYEDSWVLVVPAPEEPVCYVWAEAASEPEAHKLAEALAAQVEQAVAEEAASNDRSED